MCFDSKDCPDDPKQAVYVDVYDLWYCTHCTHYMPRGWFPKTIICPYCGKCKAIYVEDYDQYFCEDPGCLIYLPKEYGPTRHKTCSEPASGATCTGATMADPNGQCMYCDDTGGIPLELRADDGVHNPFSKKLWFCHNCNTFQPEGFKGQDPDPLMTDSGPTATHCPYCGGENEGGKSNFMKVYTPSGEEEQLFCKKCNTFLPRGWKFDNGGVDPEVWTPAARIPIKEYDYRLKEWKPNSCLKTKHWGPFRLVKPYDQWFCEHCNYFLKIGHQPDTP